MPDACQGECTDNRTRTLLYVRLYPYKKNHCMVLGGIMAQGIRMVSELYLNFYIFTCLI